MKKLLLSRVGALALTLSLSAGWASPSANAAEVTDVLTAEAIGLTTNYSSKEYTSDISGVKYQVVAMKNSKGEIQINQKKTSGTPSYEYGIVSLSSAGKLVSVKITWGSVANRKLNVFASNTAYSSTNDMAAAGVTPVHEITQPSAEPYTATYTFTEDFGYLGLRCAAANAQYIQKIEVTWDDPTASSVDRPVISCADNKVTIAAGDSGADEIYYTIDGTTEPDATSTKYDAPFDITANTTVKAIAKKGDQWSKVATFEALYVGTFANFAELAAKGAGTLGKVTGPIYVVYANGSSLWLKDAAGNYILAFGNTSTAKNGTAYSYISGEYTVYTNGVPRIINYTLGEESTVDAVEPETTTLAAINESKYNAYVKIENVAISNYADKNFVLTQDETNLAGYNAYGIDVAEGRGFTVAGIISAYNGNIQLQPIEITGGIEAVEAPVFTPAAGIYTKGTIVKVTCATEGASIFYTTNGDEATEASTPYTEAGIELTADMTINVIAVKDGMISTTASAEYTLYPEGTYLATFVFANGGNVADLTTNVIEPANTATETNNLNGVVFTSQEINLTMNKGEGSDNPRWWLNGSEPDIYYNVRIYKNNTATISANRNGYKLSSVTFKQRDPNWNAGNSADSGTLDGKVWTPAEEAITTNVKFTFAGASRFNCIDVLYVEDPDAQVSGIGNIAVDNENAPVEYFNLQGVRIDNPGTGIYIRRQGSKVEKVCIK